MKQRVLLVEPDYGNTYPPLGLMKISTWHKERKGDFVDFLKLSAQRMPSLVNAKALENNYDLIYITSLFTYHASEVIQAIQYCQVKYPHAEIKVGGIMATLLPDLIREKTGISPHKGLLPGAEDCKPDYSLFPELRCSITFTSRGCKNACKFCAVRFHEPTFFIKDNWENDIDLTKNLIIFWDNNWFFSPNFLKDIEKLKKLNIPFDFNQGLDCRLFDSEKAEALSQTRIRHLRFAFDNHSEERYIQDAVRLAKKHGFKDIRVYVLYNSPDENDTPEYFFYRINELNKLGALSYPMRFRPVNSTEGRYISPQWNRVLLRGLKLTLMFYYTKGMITRSREAFVRIYGNSEKEFKEKLYSIYEYDRQLDKLRSKASHHKVGDQVPSLL
jgi:hypothetical protein